MPYNTSDEVKKLNEAYDDALFRLVMNEAAEEEGRVLLEEKEALRGERPSEGRRACCRLDGGVCADLYPLGV